LALAACGGSGSGKSNAGAGGGVSAAAGQGDVGEIAQAALDTARMIHAYLGNNLGDDPAQWRGLLGDMKKDAIELRKVQDDFRCRIIKLEGQQCGGPGGGPSVSPKNPPNYPP
jgi:hypothetical protein